MAKYDPAYLRAIARQRAELDDYYAFYAIDREAAIEARKHFTVATGKSPLCSIGDLDRAIVGAARRYRARHAPLTGDTLLA